MVEPNDDLISRLRASSQSAPTRQERAAADARRRRRRVIIAVAVGGAVAIGVGTVAGVALLSGADPTAAPTPTATAVPSDDAAPVGPPEIALVGGDLLANPPEGVTLTIPGNTVIAATEVGERDGYTAYGLVGDSNQVCLLVEHEGTSTGDCATYQEFAQGGVTVDRVDWQVRWWADGRLEWIGLAP